MRTKKYATIRRRVAWLMFSPRFDVLCVLSEYRPTAKWSIFVLYNNQDISTLFVSENPECQISQHNNCIRSITNPKPMFSTVLELATTRFMTNRRSKFACSKISALPRSRCCLLFSLNARVYLTFPLTKTYGYGRLCDRCDYMETAFYAIVCDCLRSAISDLRSSAIVYDYIETSL